MYDYQDYENELICEKKRAEREEYLAEQADNDYCEWRLNRFGADE